jgi:hypothetical protein
LADVLSIYDDDTRDRQANKAKFDERLKRLNEFWGGKKLCEVTGATCREYVTLRGTVGGARRDLEDMRAAINHHAAEGFHMATTIPTIYGERQLPSAQRSPYHWSYRWSNGKGVDRVPGKPLKTLVADAVTIEPVSAIEFPANREICREFWKIRLSGRF